MATSPNQKAPTDIRALAERFQKAEAAYIRKSSEREQERVKFKNAIKKTAIIIVIFAVAVAAACDLLSLVDLGWIVSWIIPILSWFMVRRITAMMKTSGLITKAIGRLEREETIVRQRLAQILPARQRAMLGIRTSVGSLVAGAQSYVSTWIRDTVITQLLELIPFVDMLPFYLGQVVKMVINQNVEYQKVKKVMDPYERLLKNVDRLERLEVQFLGTQLARLMQRQYVAAQEAEVPAAQEVQEAPAPQTPPARRAPSMRDVGPALAPAY